MLLDITPTGKEIKRKLLLEKSSLIQNLFWLSFILIPLALFVGSYFHNGEGVEGEDYLKNIAMILSPDVSGQMISQGTAFLITKNDGSFSGYLLTARHVIDNNRMKGTVYLRFPNILDNNDTPLETSATIDWTTDIPFDGSESGTLTFDVALLKLDAPGMIPEDVKGFTITSEIQIQQEIAIYGFPDSEPYYAKGNVSATSYRENDKLMTMSFNLDHGISGAPVFSEETGEVLGIAIAGNGKLANIALKTPRVMELLERENKKLE